MLNTNIFNNKLFTKNNLNKETEVLEKIIDDLFNGLSVQENIQGGIKIGKSIVTKDTKHIKLSDIEDHLKEDNSYKLIFKNKIANVVVIGHKIEQVGKNMYLSDESGYTMIPLDTCVLLYPYNYHIEIGLINDSASTNFINFIKTSEDSVRCEVEGNRVVDIIDYVDGYFIDVSGNKHLVAIPIKYITGF